MAKEQLKAFITKVQADTSLQEQLKAEGADVVVIAKAAGFSITAEDLDTHRQNLSDAELEVVAGGDWTSFGRCALTVNTLGCRKC
ncbi:lantipeptide precursor/ Nif11-like leader peptide domain protein [Synechococcus sp. BIOS-E4-1]|uniref:Nif11-like leader peptide family natural product precursor n=1 Tax=Synechococcus sp. BIOS-E4-1 TaxID=1400864 RepID=UPI001646E128|nr:Nif11-like leader peptide family natural product precursor [Synechococcus sp. BIOS-E4-1]QNI54373.1 lantipeptide precursor/ Nif11-like leader peptide domain protein [Synechococcus sp. BIOS-E4-1]